MVVVVLGVSSVAVGFNRSSPSSSWRWKATGVLGQPLRCSKEGRAQTTATCHFDVANPPVLSGRVRFEVRVYNTGTGTLCYGLSIATSYLAGLQGFCAKAKSYGSYVVTSRAEYYVDFELDLFDSVDAKDQPLSPISPPWPSRFEIVFSEPAA